ncbi:MAG TPA: magnesium/cobalt transporter CorA [Nitrospirota bacterium]|jgi:magnesium transporter
MKTKKPARKLRPIFKGRKAKTGLPPGSPVHIGESRTGAVEVELVRYDEASLDERRINTVSECVNLKGMPGITWVNVDGVHDVDILKSVGDCFGLHPLVLEDIANTDQRPKMEEYEGYIYLVCRMLSISKSGEIASEQVSVIIGPGFVLSFQEEEKEGDVFDRVRDRIKANKGKIRKMGADYLAYALLDSVVDNYFDVLETFGERLDDLEEAVVGAPTRETVREIQALKKEMVFLRRSIWPLREVISGLLRSETGLIADGTHIYLRDVYDHTVHIMDTVETFRDMLSGMLDIYLSSLSNRMNEVMKVLTIIATIFIPLTFLAGVYGMNFKYLPELELHWGYFAFWGICFATAVGMIIYFKRKHWLN